MTDDAVAEDGSPERAVPGAGLGAEAVVMGLGLLLASGLAWFGSGALLLTRVANDHPEAWLDLIYVVVAMMVTVVDLALLGLFAILRGLVARRTDGRVRWSRWWAFGLAAAMAGLVVVAAATDSQAAWLFIVPALATLALYAPAVAVATRLRPPRWATAVLAGLLVAVVLMVAAPLLGLGS